MNAKLKPLALAAAVGAVTAGYAGVSHAQTYAGNFLGDMAVVPYYTVQGDFVTGVHIINTSSATQVVKLRMRRASDSMDALDFNLIMSPLDEWTGFIDDSTGNIVFNTDDSTCTAPLEPYYSNGAYPMPGLYREGAEEGYIEVIAMGQTPTEDYAIAKNAVHGSDGVPVNCGLVESNFFRNATVAPVAWNPATPKGILSSVQSAQTCDDASVTPLYGPPGTTCATGGFATLFNDFVESDNVLKVSYFIRDAASGLEFGSNAIHMADFSNEAMMTNQEPIVVGGSDSYGYLFPDLDGGSPVDTARGDYVGVRNALGVSSVINDWSVAAARNVATDWVATLPGQYLMLELSAYTAALFDATLDCLTYEAAQAAMPAPVRACDMRDIPVEVSIDIRDREEQTFASPQGGLVISPDIQVGPAGTVLQNEVNVIEWTSGSTVPVLGSDYAQSFNVAALGEEFGWATLAVSPDSTKTQGIYNFPLGANPAELVPFTDSALVQIAAPAPGAGTGTPVPIVGFVAWERSFPSDPSANYGRIIDHSYQ